MAACAAKRRAAAETMHKKDLSERDICTRFITPALRGAGWDETQIREELSFTKGRITVRGKLVSRGRGKRADYVLSYKSNLPIAVIEAKDNNHAIGDGMQQALDYAETLHIPFAFPPTATASCAMTAPAPPRSVRPPSRWTRFRPRETCGRATAPGRG